MSNYGDYADEFYVNMNLNTEMELPTSRDTLLHFFEAAPKKISDDAEFLQPRARRVCARGGQGQR